MAQPAELADSVQLSSALEDYLETIFELVRDQKVARVRDIARARGVRAASVTPAMRRLATLGLIEYREREFIDLTPAGEAAARRVFARHHVLSDFFGRVLGMTGPDAQRDACAMEHSLSDAGMDHLVRFLEYFKVCPEAETFLERYRSCKHVHNTGGCEEACEGDSRRLSMIRERLVPLASLGVGRAGTVSLVEGHGAIRQRMLDMGMLPGVMVEILRVAPARGPLWIRVEGSQLSLRRGEAQSVLVRPAAVPR